MSRTRFVTFFVAETEDFLSEKTEAEGDIAIATSTTGEGFTAKKDRFMAGRRFRNGF